MSQKRESIFYFNGYQDYLSVENPEALRLNQYTLEVWVKVEFESNGNWPLHPEYHILGKTYHDYRLTIKKDGSLNHYCHYCPSITKSGIDWRRWQHIAATFDGKTLKTYVNGELKTQTPFIESQLYKRYQRFSESSRNMAFPPHFFIAGTSSSHSGNHFKGNMAEVRVWNTVRSIDQIKDNMFHRLQGDENGLAGYWPLNHIVNNQARDESKNNNHARVSGAVEDEQLPFISRKGKDKQDKRQYVVKFYRTSSFFDMFMAQINANILNPTDAITVSCWAKLGKLYSLSII